MRFRLVLSEVFDLLSSWDWEFVQSGRPKAKTVFHLTRIETPNKTGNWDCETCFLRANNCVYMWNWPHEWYRTDGPANAFENTWLLGDDHIHWIAHKMSWGTFPSSLKKMFSWVSRVKPCGLLCWSTVLGHLQMKSVGLHTVHEALECRQLLHEAIFWLLQ